MIKCVVLSTQRSGSTVLTDYLSSGERVLLHSELFQVLDAKLDGATNEPRHYPISYPRYRKANLLRRLRHKISRRTSIEAFLTETYRSQDGLDLLGMKFMYGQAQRFPEAMDWLVQNNIKFIHLIRENALDMIVSRELAAKRGTHSMLQDLPMIQLTLDPDRVREELDRCAQEIDDYRQVCANLDSFEITYEAFVADMEQETQRILSFLGVSGEHKFSSVLKKTNPNPKSTTIANYDEIASSLQGTRFESYLA